jgi:glycosyltransferase involved in cell wall biosynthesis
LGLGFDQTIDLLKAIKRCDGVVVTSEGQAATVRQHNLNVLSVADPMPESDFRGLKCSYSQDEPFSIVWEGTAWGLQLVELVRPALEAVYKQGQFKIEFVFVGPRKRPTPLNGSYDNEEILKHNYNLPTRWEDWRLESIGQVLSKATIGIAPMPMKNPFYMNKAFSKPLSYMACGLPVVASNLPSYREIITAHTAF